MLFELSNVSVARDGTPVLERFSARIPEGITAIVGPSGSGKSTLLRLLDRLAEPGSGTIRYRGVDLRDRDPLELRREVALVPQLPALLPGSVGDNLSYAAQLANRQADVDRLCDLVGLDRSLAEREAERLSVGEQQRAMIARALAQSPAVLLLDEPTSALDEDARDAVERTLTGLRRRTGVSLVVVTHDPAQAARLAEEVVRIDAGGAVRQGPAAELLR